MNRGRPPRRGGQKNAWPRNNNQFRYNAGAAHGTYNAGAASSSDWREIQEQPNLQRTQNNWRCLPRRRNHPPSNTYHQNNNWSNRSFQTEEDQSPSNSQYPQNYHPSNENPWSDVQQLTHSRHNSSYADSDQESVHSSSTHSTKNKNSRYHWSRTVDTQPNITFPNDGSIMQSELMKQHSETGSCKNSWETKISASALEDTSNDSIDKMKHFRSLKLDYDKMLQKVNSSDIIKDCRQDINTVTEKCLQKHEKNFEKISKLENSTSNKCKDVWSNHRMIIEQQQTTFERYVAGVKVKLTENYQLPVQSAITSCTEILNEVNTECNLFKKCLPIYALRDKIRHSVSNNGVTILLADACYTPSAVIPNFLLDICKDGLIISCHSNVALCYSQYQKCLSLRNSTNSNTFIGYHIQDENIRAEDTKILFTTVKELFSFCLDEPDFSPYSCVVFSCALQRSTDADFLLEALRKCVHSRQNFKLVVVVEPVQEVDPFREYFATVQSVQVISTLNLILPVSTVWKKTSPAENYIEEITRTAVGIHTLNKEGDVLIFLPYAKDLKKVSLALSTKLQEYDFYDARCICIYENVSKQELMETAPVTSLKRTFIFTTAWAEELHLSSVSYVIDCGQLEYQYYDTSKCLELKSLAFISQARAKLRKVCAGRAKCGTCYRLYNKLSYKNKMICRELPNILKDNPFDIMMRMFQFRPGDAISIEFVEDLTRDIKNVTIALLENANAIKNNQLTPLGKRIIKLPFLPRYSKLIVLGIDWGYGYESVLLVSFFLVKRSLFFHCVKGGPQQKVEGKKLNFLVKDSDTLTFINVYRHWMENNFLKNWCVEQCLNFEVLELIRQRANEISKIVAQRLQSDVSIEIHNNSSMNWETLQEIIYQSFKENLCIYSGHYRSGYQSLQSQSVTFIHPSSPVLQKADMPQFVVFNDLQSTSRNFMMNITAIPNDLVMTDAREGQFGGVSSAVFESKLEPFVIDHVGIMSIKQILLGKKGQKLHAIEEMVKREIGSNLIVIEPSEEKGTVTVFTLPQYKERVEGMIKEILKEKMKDMFNEEETCPLELKKAQQKISISITWVRGCSITKLMLNSESENTTSDSKQCRPLDTQETSSIKHSVHLTWPRRLCRGQGYVTFDSRDFAVARRLSMKTIRISEADVDVQLSRNMENQLFLSSLDPQTTEQDIKTAIISVLPMKVSIANATIVHQKPFETSESNMNALRGIMNTVCSKLNTIYEIVMPKPENYATEMRAFINLTSAADVTKSIRHFKNFQIDRLKVSARAVFSSLIFCDIKIFTAIEICFKYELEKLHKDLLQTGNFPKGSDLFNCDASSNEATVSIKLLSNHISIIELLSTKVHKLLEGVVVDSNKIKGLHKLFTHGGHLWLRTLEKQENVHVMEDYKIKILRLYGTTKACNRSIDRIKRYMIDTDKEIVSVIDLSMGRSTRMLMKELLKKYDFSFKSFVMEFKLRSASLDIRSSRLTLHGSVENIEEAVSAIEKISQCCTSDADDIISMQEACPVCRMPPLMLPIRLEHCGHLYCLQCLKGWVSNSDFPILCCSEECDKEILLEDIRKALDYEKTEIAELLNRSMTDYVSKHAKQYVYCPAPDCPMFFNRKEQLGTVWNCSLCKNDICPSCNVVYHHGYTCQMYQGSKDDPNFSFKVWMRDRNPNCKQCPTCKAGIEKTAGCNHMTCHSCGAHFCWMCLQAFATGELVYDHMPYCRNYGK